ncbi:hypothetical protein ABEW49_20755 [Bacillus anthracis]|uniref:hypothetical protein n=1 Tax=Bacillus anthracis TaxID=1392 RepID=UPI003D21B1B0
MSFTYKKRGKGLKKQGVSVNKEGIDFEIRVFFNCDKCRYGTDNLSTGTSTINDFPELLPYQNEIELIIEQIYSMCGK